jgi:cytochrome P450 family 4
MRESLEPISRIKFLHPFTSLYREEKKALKIVHDMTLNIVKERRLEMQRGEVNNKLLMLNHYLSNLVDGRILSDDEIRSELDSSIMGTHESTKATLTFVFYHLAKYPEVQERVLEEAKMLLADDPEKHLDEIELKEIPFTESVIKETLRLFPPIPFVGRKLESELTVGEYTFPKDVEVMISLYLMGQNPEYFDKPDKFIADRFLGVDVAPTGFSPFSIGTRKCTGSKLAMASLKVITLKIVHNFKVTLPKDFKGMRGVWRQITEPREKFYLDIERRSKLL